MKNTASIIKLFFSIVALIYSNALFANITVDSTSYEAQRSVVNNLLDERVKKFGEFDQSLEKKTGFFGLTKSKNDMQQSINILQEIVKMDNKIFMETRNLLKIKDYEAEKYQQLAREYDSQVTAYMRTISKLQITNEKLKQENADVNKGNGNNKKFFLAFAIIFIALIIIIIKQYKLLKTQKLTKL